MLFDILLDMGSHRRLHIHHPLGHTQVVFLAHHPDVLCQVGQVPLSGLSHQLQGLGPLGAEVHYLEIIKEGEVVCQKVGGEPHQSSYQTHRCELVKGKRVTVNHEYNMKLYL